MPRLVEHHARTDWVPFAPLRPRPIPNRAPLRVCGAGTPNSLSIRPDGTLEGCVAVSPLAQRFGSAAMARHVDELGTARLENGLTRAARQTASTHDDSPLFRSRAEKRSRYGPCRTCRFLARCHVCPAGTLRIEGNEDPMRVPTFACAYQMAMLETRDVLEAAIGIPGEKLRIVPAGATATMEE